MMEWIKVDLSSDFAFNESSFLVMDEYGVISLGFTPFDYYDSEYWCPLPRMPLNEGVITNDEWISRALDCPN